MRHYKTQISMCFFKRYPELSSFQSKIEASQREVLCAELQEASEDCFQSKIGGKPYWSEAQPWPTNRKGAPLYFLAQINFATMPTLPPYPDKGLLQFFVDPSGELMGMDYSNRLKGDFALLYHENPVAQPHASAGPSIEQVADGPVRRALDLHWKRGHEYVPTTNRLFSWKVGTQAYKWADLMEEETRKKQVLEDYNIFAQASAIKIGGYGCFSKNDIRFNQKYTTYDYLLLQISSGEHIQWGKQGKAHFFLPKKALLEKKFDTALYTWDDFS